MTSCILCGGPAVHRHHLTGRGADGRYLDDRLTVPLCHADHVVEHQIWVRLGLDPAPISRLRRLQLFFNRLGDKGAPTELTASTCRAIADSLGAAIVENGQA